MTNKFSGKKIGIVGMGIEGFSAAQFLLEKDAHITILDRKEEKDLDEEIVKKIKKLPIDLVLGKDCLRNLNDFKIIVRSPGVKRDLEEFKSVEKKGGVITSQIKIFLDLCPGTIIGITGTKGKGTTATLIYGMLKAQGFDAYLGGNIGKPPLDFLHQLNKQSLVVLELSSFQLIDIKKSPHIAVMLMTTSEHLDYHKDVKEYVEAKRNILRFQTPQDFAIINRDYPASNESGILTPGKIYRVSRERETDNGCYAQDGKIWIKNNRDKEAIINTSEILIPGVHNLENVCTAVMAARIFNVSKKNIISVLKTFKGLEHRLELVRELKGIRYYDDSYSTTPETAIAAIRAFKAPEILILGGSSKISDFKELGETISKTKNIKAIIGIGAEWAKMKLKIKNKKLKIIEGCRDMKEIVRTAYGLARSGDVVLLSPACASFDMFKDYKDRGEQFKKEVASLVSS